MSGVPAPAGWETRRPHLPGCVAEWTLTTDRPGACARLRIFGPHSQRGKPDYPARIELHTGVVGSIPVELTDPAEAKGFGWDLMRGYQAAAAVLEQGAAVEPVDRLDYALRTGQKFGVWGGMTEQERRRLRRARAEATARG